MISVVNKLYQYLKTVSRYLLYQKDLEKSHLPFYIVFILTNIYSISQSISQTKQEIWYFGAEAGLHFINDSVFTLTDSKIYSTEGCATLMDNKDDFYLASNGMWINNKYHEMMKNSLNLIGNYSSTQSVLLVPKPGSRYISYAFVTNGLSTPIQNPGAYFSEIDMRLDSGRGGLKYPINIQLLDSSDEKITLTKHKNGRHIWVLIPEKGCDTIHSYLITEKGIDFSSRKSFTGIKIPQERNLGSIKISPDGSKAAISLYNCNSIILADFDNSTGSLSNFITIVDIIQPYGIEFSPNNNYLYASAIDQLYQIDVINTTKSNIIKKSIFNTTKLTGTYLFDRRIWGLQRAIDNKIYFCRSHKDSIGYIEFPNKDSSLCRIVVNGLYLKGKTTRWGLPQCATMASLRDFHYTTSFSNCSNIVKFSILDTSFIRKVSWNFGDSTLNNNNSNLISPEHEYKNSGIYKITLIIENNSDEIDTIVKFIKLDNLLSNSKTMKDTIFICDKSVKIEHCLPYAKYKWNTGDTICSITVTKPGFYTLTITDSSGCQFIDSTLILKSYHRPILPKDTIICSNDSIPLIESSGSKFISYLWNTGSKESTIFGYSNQAYILNTLDSNLCNYSDTILIGSINIPQFTLGNDTNLCTGQHIKYSFSFSDVAYYWQDGSTSNTYFISKSGNYHLTLKKGNCKSENSIKVNFSDKPDITLPDTLYYCSGRALKLKAGPDDFKYLWNTGDTTSSISITGLKQIFVDVWNNGCKNTDSVIIVSDNTNNLFLPNCFTPNDDFLNEMFPEHLNIEFELEIYNTWGELIYLGNRSWDGRYKSQLVPQGVYAYIIRYRTCNGRILNKSGNITIIY